MPQRHQSHDKHADPSAFWHALSGVLAVVIASGALITINLLVY